MKNTSSKFLHFFGASALALMSGGTALAQDIGGKAEAMEEETTTDDDGIVTAKEIVVQGEIGYRNRTDETVPTLTYDSDYFQRFEPLTAGDALKRVPSVTFLSDVIESDGARLRGLSPGYTQILINGEKVPGSNADRSFFMDRIPAELIDRVEIVRSSSARRTGDAVAGTINIVLRDGYELDGGYARAGGLLFDDGKVKPSFGGVFGGAVGPGRILLGANVQGRYNPKQKQSFRFGDSPENNPNYATDDFDNREDQSDIRNGTDYSFNATYDIDTEDTDFSIGGFYVRTDRTETERSWEYNDPIATTGAVRPPSNGNLTVDNSNIANIDQENYSLRGKLSHKWDAGETKFRVGFARFWEDRTESENELEFDRATPRVTADLTQTFIVDKELSANLEHEFNLGSGMDFAIGAFWQKKDRDTDITTGRNRYNDATLRGWDQFSNHPDDIAVAPSSLAANPGGLSAITEDRLDFYGVLEGKTGIASWEVGIRRETTDYTIDDLTMAPGTGRFENDYALWLPSASIKLDVTARDRITASIARTNRRPEFNFISPALLEAELGDNDLQGNPALKPETAWGFDLGYERRLGKTGIAGINFFYRKVKNLIEVANTGIEGSEGEGTFVLQPQNTGDGEVYGVEFDLSTNLAFIGLPNTGIFGNISWLDSNITDVFGDRRFNGQSEYVYNFGFIQDLPKPGIAFGATYRKQGAAYDRVVGEEITTRYGADLEIFVEKRFGDRFTIRAVGSNLLNGKKRETFNKFTTIDDQIDRDFDEYELEAEEAGPVFQLMARFAF